MFVPRIPRHKERVDWTAITHVRVKPGARGDTLAGERILDHIRKAAGSDGVAAVVDLIANFPTVRASTGHEQAFRADLRHMGNLRDSGEMSENKGLLELGVVIADDSESVYPDELRERTQLVEGAKQSVLVNKYERNRSARSACIEHYGTKCSACDFEFEAVYGGRGAGFIHVHHIRPIASIGEEYILHPIDDLRPVCPNCHAMIHRAEPVLAIDELRRVIQDMRGPQA